MSIFDFQLVYFTSARGCDYNTTYGHHKYHICQKLKKEYKMLRFNFLEQKCNVSKRLLILAIFGIVTMVVGSAQNHVNNHFNIADSDTIWLINPYSSMGYPITGAIYKAIDPKFISNRYGLTKSEKVYYNFSDSTQTFVTSEKIVQLEFSLVFFNNNRPNYETRAIFSSLNAQKKWNYYINDVLMSNDARALISSLIPQSIEGIIFTSTDTLIGLSLDPNIPSNSPLEQQIAAYKSQGSVRFYTRDISNRTIDDNKTVYLLNNNQVITRKIYEAINTVFIRSLKRDTSQETLTEYGYTDKSEIVKIDLFTLEDVTYLVTGDDCPECRIYLVDNLQMDFKVFQVLNPYYFYEITEIVEEDVEAFAPYQHLFPKEKLKWGSKTVTIIHL